MGLICLGAASSCSATYRALSGLHLLALVIDILIVGGLFFLAIYAQRPLPVALVAYGGADLLLIVDLILLAAYFSWSQKVKPPSIPPGQSPDSFPTETSSKESQENKKFNTSSHPSLRQESPSSPASSVFIKTASGKTDSLIFDNRTLGEIFAPLWAENGGQENCKLIFSGKQLVIDPQMTGIEFLRTHKVAGMSTFHLALFDAKKQVTALSENGKKLKQWGPLLKTFDRKSHQLEIEDRPYLFEDIRRQIAVKCFPDVPCGFQQMRVNFCGKNLGGSLLTMDAWELQKLYDLNHLNSLHVVSAQITPLEAEVLVEELLRLGYPGLHKQTSPAETLELAYSLMWSYCHRIYKGKRDGIGKDFETMLKILETVYRELPALTQRYPQLNEEWKRREQERSRIQLGGYLFAWHDVGIQALLLCHQDQKYSYESIASSLEEKLEQCKIYLPDVDEEMVTLELGTQKFSVSRKVLEHESCYFGAILSGRFQEEGETVVFEDNAISLHLLFYLVTDCKPDSLQNLSMAALFEFLHSAESFCFSRASLLCQVQICKAMIDLSAEEFALLEKDFTCTPVLAQLAAIYRAGLCYNDLPKIQAISHLLAEKQAAACPAPHPLALTAEEAKELVTVDTLEGPYSLAKKALLQCPYFQQTSTLSSFSIEIPTCLFFWDYLERGWDETEFEQLDAEQLGILLNLAQDYGLEFLQKQVEIRLLSLLLDCHQQKDLHTFCKIHSVASSLLA